ncbi:hypothetical protein [Paenibacillus sp. IHBB 3054]|uniref:hypothetical protein n=1 Tax=Paenibacillus sp. IHBB 3054 TaxID=3425689 RepID=UPI003F67296D
MDIDVKWHINKIKKLRAQANQIDGDAPGADSLKIELLTEAHMLMGRVAAIREGEYWRIYALRKSTYARAKLEPGPGDKATRAEIAIEELRMLEATAQEERIMWKNEHEAVLQQLFELHLRANREKRNIGGGI